MPDPIVPDHIRAAIHAGHVGQVVIFCDRCGIEEAADYTGETREIRFAAARKHLADTKAWATEAQDLCPKCNLPDQPDGIEDDSRDLPDPAVAAERIGKYIRANGDGLYDVQGGAPLYARDLEAVTRTFDHLTAERDRLASELVNARVERDEYRERMNDLVDERDGLDVELAAANRQIATIKTHFTRRTDTLTARAERAEAELATMREVARGNRRHVATLTGILDTIEQLAKRWTDRPGTPEHDCAIDILKAINSGIAAPVPGSSPRAPEPDSIATAERYLRASGIPVTETEIRAWLDERGIPVMVGVYPLFAAVRQAIIAAGDAGYAEAGGCCSSCGSRYPRRIPAGEDQRCWTCWLADPGAAESQASEPAPADVAPVLAEIAAERNRQDAKWGEQNHPDGTGDGGDLDRERADYARRRCQLRAAEGVLRWRDVIEEEIAEAFAETDPKALRGELVQVAAVAVAWVEAIDRRIEASEIEPKGAR